MTGYSINGRHGLGTLELRGTTRVVTYSRVSTDAQEKEGTSLDTQERECLEYVQANGWQVIDCIRDTSSGYNLVRPGIQKLRIMLQEGSIDGVVSYA